MSMIPSKVGSYRKSMVMPEVAHHNTSTRRVRINKIMNVLFNTAELLTIALAFICLYYYRLSSEYGESMWGKYGLSLQLPRLKEYGIFFAVMLCLWLVWTYYFRILSLEGEASISLFEEIVKSVKAITYSVLITIGIAFVFKLVDYSRLVIIVFWASSIMISIGYRSMKRLIMLFFARKGLLVKNVLIIGAGKIGTFISEELTSKPSLGYYIVGFLDDEKRGRVEGTDHSVLGKCKDLEKMIRRHPVDEIIITIPTERELINDLINDFRKYDITIRIVPELFNLVSNTVQVESINSTPYITLIKTPMQGIPYLSKRTMDFLLAFIGLVILIPLFIVVGFVIKVDSKGPIYYKQKRVGRNGKFFNMYKFRSMVHQADKLQHKLMPHNEMDGAVFKISDDPRITRVGKFIRKYSIDELPQLFNVLRGEMSLVGPRPPLPREVEQYTDVQWRRLEVIPGITGLWQVSGRSELSFEHWINLDIYYIENWRLLLDLQILLRTIPAVIKGEGAY